MSKKIFILRHGQTEYNRMGIVQGSGVDASLNDEGRRQAALFFETFKSEPFQKIYVSGLKRTYESVEKFIDLGIPFEKLTDLNEIHWGRKEGQTFTAEENAYYHQMLDYWKSGRVDFAIDGGESPIDVSVRMKRALHNIMTDSAANILICMHGRAMRVLLCVMLNIPLRCMDNFLHGNLCLYELVWTGSMFRLSRYNDGDHLLDRS